ncbi:MAG TPA: pitrilysin family protein [Xanthobacteraceae bacterium]|nr:pitrilysin family protein [Xanthobacteraceae bacterium]
MLNSRILTFAGIIAAALAAAPLSAGAQGAPETKNKVAHFTLTNGLELVVIPDRRAPIVTHMIWYRVGAADEQAGKSGIAHFLEHLMFKGTKKHPAGYFSRLIASVGGQENAFTSSDYTAYYQRVPREHLAKMMELEADRMTGLVLTDEVVLPERDVVLEEQNSRVANNPRARLSEQMEAALFVNHPYGRPVIGWRPEIEKLNREDALAFYKRYYGPNNAIVIVAGDVEPDQVRSLAENFYGKIERSFETKPRLRPQEPPPAAARLVTLADPRVEQRSVQRNYLVPSATTAKRGESEALEVLGHVLGGGSNSRLYRALVVEKGIAVSAGAGYLGSAIDLTRFSVYATPANSTTLPQLESAIEAVITELAEKGVSAEELERSKTRLIADSIYAQDSQSTLARWYGAALTTGLTVDSVLTWPERIRAVTADAVRNAARQWLDNERAVTGYLVKTARPEEKRTPEEKRS